MGSQSFSRIMWLWNGQPDWSAHLRIGCLQAKIECGFWNSWMLMTLPIYKFRIENSRLAIYLPSVVGMCS
jgi:hypothetical protein